MDFKIVEKSRILLVGKEIRTSNKDEDCSIKIQTLWKEFSEKKLGDAVHNKLNSDEILGVYTDYENKEFGYYSFVVGFEVSNGDDIPEGMVLKIIPPSKYCVITAKGKMPESIGKAWQYIWNADIKRSYTGDFELYDKRYNDNENPEVDIYVAVK
ncbi:GyrI-like domain-containing protein [Clostridium sp. BJN0013]|uniref:GyrI-like domain-containing protein n=1 Tax=Clostridium sp. BJN0013 TaxID=3236840 RepID=UPI0034C672DC